MRLRAYAKVNLSLDILRKREDGLHDLEMVMQSVSLCDLLTVERREAGGAVLHCPHAPQGEGNTALRAARAFLRAVGSEGDGVFVGVEKHIPMQAGMGGGSADAAAVLRALNALYGEPLGEGALCALGLGIGADVPFCLRGGTLLACGVGERLTVLPALPECYIVVCKPPLGVSTAEAFAQADARPGVQNGHTARLLRALGGGALPQVGAALGNDFEDLLEIAEVANLRDRMLAAGALGACMTGSGSAVLALFEGETAARACARGLAGMGEAFVCRPMKIGVEIL